MKIIVAAMLAVLILNADARILTESEFNSLPPICQASASLRRWCDFDAAVALKGTIKNPSSVPAEQADAEASALRNNTTETIFSMWASLQSVGYKETEHRCFERVTETHERFGIELVAHLQRNGYSATACMEQDRKLMDLYLSK